MHQDEKEAIAGREKSVQREILENLRANKDQLKPAGPKTVAEKQKEAQ